MNSRWLAISLRVAGVLFLVLAALSLTLGGLSFRSEQQISADTYVIRHTVILGHSPVIIALIGVVLFGLSLMISRKKV